METRQAAKRKEAERTEASGPAKRTRSSKGTGAAGAPAAVQPAPPASRTRPSRKSRQPAVPAGPADPEAAPVGVSAAEPVAGLSEPPSHTTGPQAHRNSGEAAGDKGAPSMERSGRRNSRSGAQDTPRQPDDERDPGESFGRNFSAGSALQGLLKKLGAGFEDILPGMSGVSSSRIKSIVSGLRQEDDEGAQLVAVTDLCELLSISTEDNLASFPVEQITPLLVNLLALEHNPDMMLLAARCLTFMADVLPASCSTIVRHGAVPALCSRLLNIEYIDLAEQSLQALEKLAVEHPRALLQAGGLMAVLTYLDFFPSSVQRTAVTTAANMCSGITQESFDMVQDAVPQLTQLLQYADAKVVDGACSALLLIVEAFKSNAELLEGLQRHGLVDQARQLVSISDNGTMTAPLSLGTYFGLIKLLATAAGGSAAISEALLNAGITDQLRLLFSNCAMLSTSGGAGAVLRTPDQLFEVVSLAHALLPDMPDAATVVGQGMPSQLPSGQGEAGSGETQACARLGFLRSEPGVLLNFTNALLPLLLKVYSATVMPTVRHRCLATIAKMLYFSTAEQLRQVLLDLPMSSFLASLLSSRDARAQAFAIQMAELLMVQLPDVFRAYFVKEGVLHALEQLSSQAAPGSAQKAAPDQAGAAAEAPAGATTAAGADAGGVPPSPPVTRSRRSQSGGKGASEDGGPPAAAAPGTSKPPLAPPPPTGRASGGGGPSAAAAAGGSSSAGAAAAAAAAAAGGAAGGSRALQRSSSTTLKEAVCQRAARFLGQHFQSQNSPGGAAFESSSLQELRQQGDRLARDEEALVPLLKLITSSDISVFELLSSGAVRCLTQYLHGTDLSASNQHEQQLLQRLRAFAAAGQLPADQGGDAAAADAATVGASNTPLTALVCKLQTSLASAEAFPVLVNRMLPTTASMGRSYGRSGSLPGSFSGAGSLSSGLAALSQPFKLRLVRHDEEGALREYSSNIVLIEPLATMTAIEDFLWPRVNRGSTAEQLRAREPPAAAAPAAAGGSNQAAGGSGAAAAAAGGAQDERRRSAGGAGPAAPAADGVPSPTGARSRSATTSQQQQGRAASQARPIPDAGSRRMTRAQARAAEASAEEQRAAQEAAAAAAAAAGRNARGAAAAAAAAAAGADLGSDEGAKPMDHDGHLMLEDQMEVDEDSQEEGHDHDHDHGHDHDEDMHEDGMYDDEDEEVLDEEEDDGSGDLGVGSLPVHDLHLADAPGTAGRAAAAAAAAATAAAATPGGSAAAARGGSGAGGSATAAAAAAAAAAAGAAGARTAASVVAPQGPGSKLLFYMDGQPIPGTWTVFQAIQQHNHSSRQDNNDELDDGEANGAGRGSRPLWDMLYTLHYRLSPAPGEQLPPAAAAGPGPGSLGTGSVSRVGSMGAAAASTTAAAAGVSRPFRDAQGRTAAGVGSSGGGGSAAAGAGAGRPTRGSGGLSAALAAAAARAAPAGGGAGGLPSSSSSGGAAGAGAGAGATGPSSSWASTPLVELLTCQLPLDLTAPQSALEVLQLLLLVEALNRLGVRLMRYRSLAGNVQGTAPDQLVTTPREEFINTRIASKLSQQLKDVLSICSGGLPAWCRHLVFHCKFLFPLDVRRRYFYATAFGLGRALQHLQQQQTAEGVPGTAADRDGRESRIGRLQRQKVRVSRKRILESAHKVMELYAKHKAVLELEYFNEVGTGLGPTLEFYTLLSHDLQKRSLGMWRTEEPPATPPAASPAGGDGGGVVLMEQDTDLAKAAAAAASGPARASASPSLMEGANNAASNTLQGAASLLSRGGSGVGVNVSEVSTSHDAPAASAREYVIAPCGLFPAPLAPSSRSSAAGAKVIDAFKLLGRTVAKALQDSRLLDLPLSPLFFRAALGKPLDLYDIASIDPALGASLQCLDAALTAHVAGGGQGALLLDGCTLEDMCLTFTLPGYPSYPLCPDGMDTPVTPSNLQQYLDAVVDATLGTGITGQLGAFREGFNEVFDLHLLDCFYEEEIETLLCGAGEKWSVAQLADSIKFDHGYTSSSTPVRHLLEILADLEPADQRRFLRFVTGSPRLPPGGIASLQPRLTVVRKHPSAAAGADLGAVLVGDWSNGTVLADGDLPSVMTCANYVKLPPYSSKQVMLERLLYAIREGQGSFDLS